LKSEHQQVSCDVTASPRGCSMTRWRFGGEHGRAIVADELVRQASLLGTLAQAVNETPGVFGEVPLRVTADAREVVEQPGSGAGSSRTIGRCGSRPPPTPSVHHIERAIHCCLAARNSRATSSMRGYLPWGTERRALSRSPSARSGWPSAKHTCANIEVAISLASSDE
jgi:hypothetical protein